MAKSAPSIFLHLTPTSLPHFAYCSKEGCKQFFHSYPLHSPEVEEKRFQSLSNEQRQEEMRCQRRCLPFLKDGGPVLAEEEMQSFIDIHRKKCGGDVREVRW